MKRVSKWLSVTLAAIMFMGIGTTAFASETQTLSDLKAVQIFPYDEKLDRLDWHDYRNLEAVSTEDTYSYDEFIIYLKDNGFTDVEAAEFAGKRPIEARGTNIYYSLLKMDTFTYSGGYKLQPRFHVGLEYNEGSPSPNRIVSIGNPTMYTDEGLKCVFTGNIFYELYSGNEFYYDFNGDVYKHGDLLWNVGGQIRIGNSSSISGSVTNGSGYVTNVSESGTYYSQGLAP